MFLPLGDDVEKREPPIGTALLIAANLLVFIYTFRLTLDAGGDLAPHMQFCADWGLVPKALASGQLWSLVTCQFIHGDFFHFLGNMVVLWAFAQTLEHVLGTVRFLSLYFVCGLAAGVAQCAADFQSEIPMVGASGAIAGVIGAYCFAFGLTANIRTLVWWVRPMVVPVPACLFAVVWLLMQWSGVLDAADEPEQGGGVAWMAHIGGFFAGTLLMPLMNHGGRQLVRNWQTGATVIADMDPTPRPARRTAAAAPVESNDCAYCGTSLETAAPLASNLLRCGNSGCQRLNYRTAPIATAAAEAPAESEAACAV